MRLHGYLMPQKVDAALVNAIEAFQTHCTDMSDTPLAESVLFLPVSLLDDSSQEESRA
jgi:hypothetical protein